MSITLYTPATGFPDLEAKIAYGLARVGVEALGMEKVAVHADGGFYTVSIDIAKDEFFKLDRTFNMLCKRLLASEYIPITTPGIKKSGKRGGFVGNITVKEDESFSLGVFQQTGRFYWNNTKDEPVCGHSDPEVVGAVLGLAAESSYHHSRDKLDFEQKKDKDKYYIGRPSNPKRICKVCGLLSLIGMWYSSFIFNIMNKQYKVIQEIVTIPIPKQGIKGSRLQEIFSLQHQIRKAFLPELPQTLIPLAFLSKIPSSSDILDGFDLFIAVLSRQQGYHVDGLFLIHVSKYLDFLRANSYNIALVDTMLRREAFTALQELNNIIYYNTTNSLPKFARLYVQETSTKDSTNLLYPETSKYLLQEVAMIKQEIIENPALGSLARTLRYFIRERKYGYADDIRNARKESKDFEDTIAKMLREGRLRLEQREKIHLPTDEEMKEVFRLANADFDKTKTALVILAFSFPSKGEEENTTFTEEVQNA